MVFTGCLLPTGWIKTQPAQKILLRVKFTVNPCSYHHMYMKGYHWNTCKLVFAATCIREPIQCRTRTRVYVNAALLLLWFTFSS